MKIIPSKLVKSCNPRECPHFYFNMFLVFCDKSRDLQTGKDRKINGQIEDGKDFPNWCPLKDEIKIEVENIK